MAASSKVIATVDDHGRRRVTCCWQGGICRGEAGELPPHWIWGNGNGEGRERGKGRVGRPPVLLPPTGFCLKYHPGCWLYVSDAPVLTQRPTVDVVVKGMNLTLHCAADGNPPVTYTWIKVGYTTDP